MAKNLVIAALVAALAIGGALAAFAASQRVWTSVDVAVWQSKSSGTLYISTRAQGDTWVTHSTPLDLSQSSESGRYWQSDTTTVRFQVNVADPPSGTTGQWIYEEVSSLNDDYVQYALKGDSGGWLLLQCYSESGTGRLVWLYASDAAPQDIVTFAYRVAGGVRVDIAAESFATGQWNDHYDAIVMKVGSPSREFGWAVRNGTQLSVAVFGSGEQHHEMFEIDGADAVFAWYEWACPNSLLGTQPEG